MKGRKINKMYELNGYIIWYNTKNHKWKIKNKITGIVETEIGSIKKVKEYCKGAKK